MRIISPVNFVKENYPSTPRVQDWIGFIHVQGLTEIFLEVDHEGHIQEMTIPHLDFDTFQALADDFSGNLWSFTQLGIAAFAPQKERQAKIESSRLTETSYELDLSFQTTMREANDTYMVVTPHKPKNWDLLLNDFTAYPSVSVIVNGEKLVCERENGVGTFTLTYPSHPRIMKNCDYDFLLLKNGYFVKPENTAPHWSGQILPVLDFSQSPRHWTLETLERDGFLSKARKTTLAPVVASLMVKALREAPVVSMSMLRDMRASHAEAFFIACKELHVPLKKPVLTRYVTQDDSQIKFVDLVTIENLLAWQPIKGSVSGVRMSIPVYEGAYQMREQQPYEEHKYVLLSHPETKLEFICDFLSDVPSYSNHDVIVEPLGGHEKSAVAREHFAQAWSA